MQRFVITGVSRLAVRVARRLHRTGAEVVVVVKDDDDPSLLGSFGAAARVLVGDHDRAVALRDAGIAGADGLLALDDDDLENLRSVSCATAVAPDVPIVLRSFDANLADQLEVSANIRRAYSLSALAAPSFVAAAIGDQALQTLRLGDDEIPLVQLTVGTKGPVVGHPPSRVAAESGATVVARRRSGERWTTVTDDGPLDAGDEVLVGGHLVDVLRLALANDPLPAPPPRRRRAEETLAERIQRRKDRFTQTLLPATIVLLILFIVAASMYFGAIEDLGAMDAVYFTFITAFGGTGLFDADGGEQIAALLTMLAFGALVGVLFSYLASVAVAQRAEYRMERQAARRRGHIVVVGVGTIGYRVVSLLDELGVDVVGIEQSASSRFLGAAAAHGPMLVGNARLPEDLARTSIARATCLVATADDDLVNISACLQARAMNPTIRTVARIYDETIAGHVSAALGVDVVVSASRAAAPTFAGAALDDRAPRTVRLDGLELTAFRHTFTSAAEVAAVRGVCVLAADGPTAIVVGASGSPAVAALLSA